MKNDAWMQARGEEQHAVPTQSYATFRSEPRRRHGGGADSVALGSRTVGNLSGRSCLVVPWKFQWKQMMQLWCTCRPLCSPHSL